MTLDLEIELEMSNCPLWLKYPMGHMGCMHTSFSRGTSSSVSSSISGVSSQHVDPMRRRPLP